MMTNSMQKPLQILGEHAEIHRMDFRIHHAVMGAVQELNSSSSHLYSSVISAALDRILMEQRSVSTTNLYLAYLQYFYPDVAGSGASEEVRFAKARSLYQNAVQFLINSQINPRTKDVSVFSFIITLTEQLRDLCKLACSPPKLN